MAITQRLDKVMEYENNKFRFNHDIIHCVGEGCDKREHCMRYLAFQEIKDDAYRYWFLSIPADVSNCKKFINVNIKK